MFSWAVAACGGTSDDAPAPLPPSSNTQEQRIDQSLVVDGRTRSYTLVLPPNVPPWTKVPLVVALHGGGGTAAQFEATSLLTNKARLSGFAVLYPNGVAEGGLGLQTWNAGGCCGAAVAASVDDVNFVRQMIQTIVASHPIDSRRVYATGHSNGGMLAHRLACELSDMIAAVAPNAAALMISPCQPTRGVPVLHMHSKLDTNVLVQGGVGTLSGVAYPPLATTMSRWTAANACSAVPQVKAPMGSVTQTTWTGCRNDAIVSQIITDDGGHAWPGGLPGRTGSDTPSVALNANDALWAFFSAYALP